MMFKHSENIVVTTISDDETLVYLAGSEQAHLLQKELKWVFEEAEGRTLEEICESLAQSRKAIPRSDISALLSTLVDMSLVVTSDGGIGRRSFLTGASKAATIALVSSVAFPTPAAAGSPCASPTSQLVLANQEFNATPFSSSSLSMGVDFPLCVDPTAISVALVAEFQMMNDPSAGFGTGQGLYFDNAIQVTVTRPDATTLCASYSSIGPTAGCGFCAPINAVSSTAQGSSNEDLIDITFLFEDMGTLMRGLHGVNITHCNTTGGYIINGFSIVAS